MDKVDSDFLSLAQIANQFYQFVDKVITPQLQNECHDYEEGQKLRSFAKSVLSLSTLLLVEDETFKTIAAIDSYMWQNNLSSKDMCSLIGLDQKVFDRAYTNFVRLKYGDDQYPE